MERLFVESQLLNVVRGVTLIFVGPVCFNLNPPEKIKSKKQNNKKSLVKKKNFRIFVMSVLNDLKMRQLFTDTLGMFHAVLFVHLRSKNDSDVVQSAKKKLILLFVCIIENERAEENILKMLFFLLFFRRDPTLFWVK